MNRYLVKLKAGVNCYNAEKNMGSKYNISSHNINCGNGFKEGLRHRFVTDIPSEVKLLINMIKRFKLDVKIENVTENSFEFESPSMEIQIFIFRICRYTRIATLKRILENTFKISKEGIKFQNAFLLAHFVNCNSYYKPDPNYYETLDIVYDNFSSHSNNRYYLHKPFKNLKDLKKVFKTGMTYNTIYNYKSFTKTQKTTFINLVKEGDYKAAEKYLFFVFK